MHRSELFSKAQVVVVHCLGVKEGENVLVVDDQSLTPDTIDAFRSAAEAQGAAVAVLSYRNPRFIPLKEYCLMTRRSVLSATLEEEAATFPRTLIGAASNSDAIVMVSSDLEFLYSKTIKGILSRGVRIIALSYLAEEGIVRMLPSNREEVQTLRETTERITRIFEKSRTAKVTSDAGTNLTVKIGQYPVLPHLGVADRGGKWQLLPAGQITNIPDDHSAEGTVVIDRTIAANDYKEISEPVKFTVRNGDVVSVEGGVEAEKLRRFLESLNHKNMYHLTELAVGVNPKCKFSGIGAPAEDTHVLGCVSLALGCDVHLGGSHAGPAHIDMTMRYPSITVDGKQLIVEKGRLVA